MVSRRTNNTLLVLAALALAAAGLYQQFGGTSGDDSDDRSPRAGNSAAAARAKNEPSKLRLSTERIDLGTISHCEGARTFELLMTNDGTEPITVSGWRATCSCVSPNGKGGFAVLPGETTALPIRVEPQGAGGKSQRIDFRIDGSIGGPRVRIDYVVASVIRPRPSVVMRPTKGTLAIVDLERSAPDGAFIEEAFLILGTVPQVAKVFDVPPSMGLGLGGIEIDFAAIDALAKLEGVGGDPAFEWETTASGVRWKSLDLVVRTDLPACSEVHVTIKNG